MDKSIASEVRACLSRSVDEYPYDEHHRALQRIKAARWYLLDLNRPMGDRS